MEEKKNSKVVEASFKMKFQHEVEKDGKKVMVDDTERTEIKFSLDFSKLSEGELITYAQREVVRILNSELRDGERKLEEIQGKTIEVEPLEVGTRGARKVTPDKAKEVLAGSLGMTVEELEKLLTARKGAAK